MSLVRLGPSELLPSPCPNVHNILKRVEDSVPESVG